MAAVKFMNSTTMITTTLLFLLLLLLLPSTVLGDGDSCAGDDTCRDKPLALKLKLGALGSILVAGAIGIFIPIAGKSFPALQPDGGPFFAIKAFAAGVILATGFIHVLPDAFENLTSSCLRDSPWHEFPFAGFIAMVAALGTLMVDAAATGFYKNMESNNRAKPVGDSDMEAASEHAPPPPMSVHTHASHGHAHGTGVGGVVDPESELIRHRVISQVLELGIIVHSVIIGVSLGASESPCTIRPLLGALSFHQFFEGMGLGGCLVQAKFKKTSTFLMAIFFSLTTPIGIVIGLFVSSVYNENSPTALIVEGVFNSASAGILIYMALVDLLAADFMNPKLQSNRKLKIVANISLLLGAGFMSLLAKWA